ncbi:MAG: site-2 protease family protein [Pyrinomonadaceae bacterium]|nr:site-2 protease family protein [Pyrinomonadaceae bacterium]
MKVASVYGIPVRIDYRWFVVFALSVWVVANAIQRMTAELVTVNIFIAWTLGAITTLALFLSVFGHELSHALIGRVEGIEIEDIVLHPFGGVARLRHEPDSPRAEFRIAVAGPAASFIFALLAFGAMAVAAMGKYWVAAAVFRIVAWWNLLLAVFNLFPGYPLDGGRVLRAFLWHRAGNMNEATRIASLCGQVIAWTLIVFGFYFVIAWRDYFMGLWTVLVGLFLRSAAASVVKAPPAGGKFGTVAEAMIKPIIIAPDILISHFVDTILPVYRQTSFPVAENGSLHGILALEDLKALPRERWHRTKAREVMRPVSPSLFVASTATMAEASAIMQRNGTGSLAVIDPRGQLVGFLQQGIRKKRKRMGK